MTMAKQFSHIALVVSVMTVCVTSQGIIPGIANICFEPAETGVCRAYVPAFYFNPLSGACDCFVYGGCRGNNNRFSTLEECMSTCSVRKELQFNTPACERIFKENNPLASLSARQPLNPVEQRQPLPVTQAPVQPPVEPAPQPQPVPVQLVTQAPVQPVPQPQPPASRPEQFDKEGSESSQGSKTINSVVIGSTGVRTGTLTIGQPVSIPGLRPQQQIQGRTGQAGGESQASKDEELEE